MTENHPLIPPAELVQQWTSWACEMDDQSWNCMATWAAQWGADQELEACCELMDRDFMAGPSDLRAARRPKPPSLKEQALAALNEIEDKMLGPTVQEKLIRRALEQLDD